jgi:valyl-tRNA synthetase
MPFITEELWHRLPRVGGPRSVSLAPFTLVNERAADSVSEKQFADLQELIVAARNAKAEMGLQNARPSAQVASQDARCWRFTATIRKASRAWPASRRSTSRAPGSRAGRD